MSEEGTYALKRYRAPWKGQLLLACLKCQKKRKRQSSRAKPLKLKKAMKQAMIEAGSELRVRVIQVACLKLCPKGAIAVCTQEQLGRGECSMVKTADDVRMLAAECRATER